MKTKMVSPQQAAAMQRAARFAPMLQIKHPEDQFFYVKRVGFLGSIHRPEAVHFETTEGKIYRLPPELTAWAVDVVALALSFHNPFPCTVRFLRDSDGKAWAEVDVDPLIEPLWQPGVDHAAAFAASLKNRK